VKVLGGAANAIFSMQSIVATTPLTIVGDFLAAAARKLC
jgi:hypothetical protein